MADETTMQKESNFLSRMPIWQKILIGMIAGMVVGVVMGPQAEVLKPLGTLFINCIKMLIVPLVFCSLVVGVTSMQDTKKMGRVGVKSLVLYLGTTAIAISIGLGMATIFKPGIGIDMVAAATGCRGKRSPDAGTDAVEHDS